MLLAGYVEWACYHIILRPRQNERHFLDIFQWISLNENIGILIKISLKFVPRVSINNIPAFFQMMPFRRPGISATIVVHKQGT